MNYKEVFKLAQQKGFKLYFGTNAPCQSNSEYYNDEAFCELSLIQKWLRENHLIWVMPKLKSYQPDKPRYAPEIRSLSSKNMGEELLTGFLYVYEYSEALLVGIYEALKLI